MSVLDIQELIKKTAERRFYIYDAGGAAKRFYRALEKQNSLKNFLGFIISDGEIKSDEKVFYVSCEN